LKTNTQQSLDLKRTRNSSASNHYKCVDSTYRSVTGFMRIALLTTLPFGLISNSYFAHAETNVVRSYLQEVAKSNAQELGGIIADEHWTRIEFSSTYIEPIVVSEEPIANANSTYVVGIRNVDAVGFEIILKNCNKSTGIPVQENVNFSVIDRSRLPVTEGSISKIRQQFSWGKCPVTAITTGAVS